MFKLYNQYLSATKDTNGSFSDFVKWLDSNHKRLLEYAKLLKSLSYFDFSEALQIGKGVYDSIIDEKLESATKYIENASGIQIVRGVPYINNNGYMIESPKEVVLTHNPYDDKVFSIFKVIHNMGMRNISLGVYGSISDFDYKKKYDSMVKLSNELTDDYVFDYEINSGNYFVIINSKRKIKVLVKTI